MANQRSDSERGDSEYGNVEAFYNWMCKIASDITYKRKCAYHEGNLGEAIQLQCKEDVLERVILRYKEVLGRGRF